ncbi:MAG: tautomerase family protein [Gammaproteobacteria bacterium]|nr:MAG: tautomerase family protein [Gammaproteobacteria bacterium]
MSQIKIYGLKETLDPIKKHLSDVIHSCVMAALQFPADKRAHRFIGLEQDDFFMPAGRSIAYIIIEITMIEGRSLEARKKLIRLLFDRIKTEVGIDHMDVEVCIYESPACNWGFRGMHGDEIKLNYNISV